MRTQVQVEKYRQQAPALAVDVAGLLDKRWTLDEYCGQIVEWLHQQSDAATAPMVYATTSVAELHNIQQRYGAEPSRLIVEMLFFSISKTTCAARREPVHRRGRRDLRRGNASA